MPALWLTYAVAASLSVWLARCFVGGISRRAAILLALAPLVLTGKAMLLGQLYGPGDLYYAHDPWASIAAAQGVGKIANPILSDLAFANLPWRAAVREAVVNGRFPLLDRFGVGGAPLLASAQAAVFHPSTWLGIFLPVALSWTFSCAFTLFLALLSAFLFFHDFKLSETAALAGAVGWGFSTYIVFWDGWSVGTSTATLPLLLLGLRRIARAERRSVGLTVTALVLMVAGGHPESWLHAAAAAGAFFVWELVVGGREPVLHALGRAAGAAALAILLSAPQLLPLLEAIPHSAEYRARRAAAATSASSQSVSLREAARRMLPAVLPFAHGIYGKSPVQAERADGSGVPLAYAGAMLFPLAALGLFSRRPPVRGRTIFILFVAAGLLAGASAPGLLDLLTRLPGFSMALNYRLVFLAGLGLAGLAAFGAEAIVLGEARRAAAHAAGWAVVLAIVFILSRGVFGERGLPDSFVASSFAAEIAPLILFAGLALFARVGAGKAAALALTLLVLQRGVEMWATYPTLPASILAPRLSALDALTRGRPGRVAAVGEIFRPNAAALYGVEDVRGYESIVLDRLADTFPLWSFPQAASFNRVDDLTRPFLAFLNVRYAIAPPQAPLPTGWRVLEKSAAVLLLDNPGALPRAFVPKAIRAVTDPQDTIPAMATATDFGRTVWLEDSSSSTRENGSALLELREVGPELEIAADATSPALIATSIPNWPGWRAETAGRDLPIVTVDHAFVGFAVDPGRSLVRLHYRPPSWSAAMWSLAAGLTVLASAARRRTRRNSTSRRSDPARQDRI